MPKYMMLFGFLQALGVVGLMAFLITPHSVNVLNLGLVTIFVFASFAFGAWGYFAGYEQSREDHKIVDDNAFVAHLARENA